MPAPASSSTESPSPFQAQFLLPRYWGIWLTLAMILPLLLLPLSWQLWLGKQLGLLLFHLIKRRRQDTLTNLSLCFPEYTTEQHLNMARAVFINAGVGIFESLNAWFQPHQFDGSTSIEGLEHLHQAQNDGQAILLLGAHYTLLDLGGLLCTHHFKANIVYRPQNNALLEWFIHRARTHIFQSQIAARDMRKLSRCLKNGHIVWYTPDQDFGLSHGIMAPFFGVPAATITAPQRLARIGNTKVLAVHFYRCSPSMSGIPDSSSPTPTHSKKPHYHITITPALDNYPSGDKESDTVRINTLLETLIRIAPTQYMWFHRRFKTQINGQNPYQK